MRRHVLPPILLGLMVARPVRAENAVEPIALVYQAPAQCPNSEAFFRQITGRTGRARAALAGEPSRVLHVDIAPAGNGFTGRLQVEDANGRSSPRAIDGASCEELVEALGLVAALTVNPRASITPPRAPDATSPSTTSPEATSQDAASRVTPSPTSPPTTRQAPVSNVTPPLGDPASEQADTSARTRQGGVGRFAIGVQAGGAAIAGLVAAGQLFGQLELGDRTSSVTPTLRLGVARSLLVDRAPLVGHATLQWTEASVEGCPLRVSLIEPFAFRPCAGLAGGVIEAGSSGVEKPRQRTRPWFSANLLGRLTWEPVASLAVELDAGAVLPLYRETFFFEPSSEVYQAPVIALTGRAGVAVRIP